MIWRLQIVLRLKSGLNQNIIFMRKGVQEWMRYLLDLILLLKIYYTFSGDSGVEDKNSPVDDGTGGEFLDFSLECSFLRFVRFSIG